MADLIATELTATTKIVDIEGEKVHRTTTVTDVTQTELEADIVRIDAQIAATIARYVTPLEARKAEIEAKIAQLSV